MIISYRGLADRLCLRKTGHSAECSSFFVRDTEATISPVLRTLGTYKTFFLLFPAELSTHTDAP